VRGQEVAQLHRDAAGAGLQVAERGLRGQQQML
jgi:hypothetical protein